MSQKVKCDAWIPLEMVYKILETARQKVQDANCDEGNVIDVVLGTILRKVGKLPWTYDGVSQNAKDNATLAANTFDY